MGHIVCEKRRLAMISKLGEAVNLIDNEAFLPMFRNRQINHPEEFEKSIEVAKRKKQPSHYFAKIWSKSNTFESVKMLRKLINSATAKIVEKTRELKSKAAKTIENANFSISGRTKYEQLKKVAFSKKE